MDKKPTRLILNFSVTFRYRKNTFVSTAKVFLLLLSPTITILFDVEVLPTAHKIRSIYPLCLKVTFVSWKQKRKILLERKLSLFDPSLCLNLIKRFSCLTLLIYSIQQNANYVYLWNFIFEKKQNGGFFFITISCRYGG